MATPRVTAVMTLMIMAINEVVPSCNATSMPSTANNARPIASTDILFTGMARTHRARPDVCCALFPVNSIPLAALSIV
jgi:hypothetical protein